MKNYAKQLKKEEVRNVYDTIIIDTVGLMWGLCEKFIKTQKDIGQDHHEEWRVSSFSHKVKKSLVLVSFLLLLAVSSHHIL